MSGSLSPTRSLTCSPTLVSPPPPPTFCHWEAVSSRGSGSCRRDLDHPGDAGSCLAACSPPPIPSALSTLRCDAHERSDIFLRDSLVKSLDSSWGSVFAICEFLLVLFFIPFTYYNSINATTLDSPPNPTGWLVSFPAALEAPVKLSKRCQRGRHTDRSTNGILAIQTTTNPTPLAMEI